MRKGNIFLTGFMGTGKSEVGRRLAERLGWRFVDTDALIEREEHLTIPEIFTRKGEPYFRRVEGRVVEGVCGEEVVVVATGGGAIVDEGNRQRMQESGVVVCLTASPETILARVAGSGNRPLLQGDEPLELSEAPDSGLVLQRIHSLLSQRAAAYARADITVETSGLSVDEVVEEVLRHLRK